MTYEIVKEQKVILMKNGLPLFVEADRVKALEDILASGSGHRFVKIDDKTINSAEIAGIYTVDAYEELQRVKQGDWKCRWGKWHMKKETCECARAVKQKEAQDRERASREKEPPPPTAEERAAHREKMTHMNEEAVLKGANNFMRDMYAKGNRSGRKIRRSTIDEWEKEHGALAPEILAGIEIDEKNGIVEEAQETSKENE